MKTFKQILETKKSNKVTEAISKKAKFSITEIRNAMIDSKAFNKDDVLTRIGSLLKKETGKSISPKSRFSWDIINTALTNGNYLPKTIVRLLSELAKLNK